MFESLRKRTQNFFSGVASLWHPPENKLTILLGAASFISLYFLQYPLILAAGLTFSTMLLSYSLAKTLKFFYSIACDLHQLVKNTDEVVTTLKEKLDRTDATLNDQFSPAALELMTQATATLVALEAQMPDVGQGIKTAKAFQKSTVGSVVTSLLGVGKSKSAPAPVATPPNDTSSQPILAADGSKKARK